MRVVTVLRAHGLRVVIFMNDHPPAHVHVFGDGEAKINLDGPGNAVELVWTDGLTRADVRRAIDIVAGQRMLLLTRWKEIHEPTD